MNSTQNFFNIFCCESFALPDAIDNNDWLTIHIYTIDIR